MMGVTRSHVHKGFDIGFIKLMSNGWCELVQCRL